MRFRFTAHDVGLVLVLALAAGVLVALSTGVGVAQSGIDGCTELDQEGETYELTADIQESNAETCLEITADDITLDGMGHTIDGMDRVDDDSIGIFVTDADGVTVENVAVTGWDTGIELSQADDGEIRESEVTANDWKGIYVVGTGTTITASNSGPGATTTR